MRSNPTIRKEQILQAAIKLGGESRYNTMTRDEVAEAAGVSPGLINHYFTSIESLRYDVLERACKTEQFIIIAQAVVDNNPFVFTLTTQSLRKKALRTVADDTRSI